MSGLPAVWWRLWRTGRNASVSLATEQPLRGMALAMVVMVVWALLTGLFLGLLGFLDQSAYQALKPRLLSALLSLFFFTLFFLVAISATLLVWGALFRTRGAVFHAGLPLAERELYWSAAVEGGLWASWAVVVLAAPLVGTLGSQARQLWLYLPAALSVLAAFIILCMAAGALGALLLARLIPLLRKGVKGIVLLVALVVAVLAVVALGALEQRGDPATFMRDVIGRLGFAENPYLPAWWAEQALSAAMQSRWLDWLWFTGLLASTAAMLAVTGEWMAGRRLRLDLDALTGRPDAAGRPRSRRWRLPPLLQRDVALLVAKDLRLFLRDPAQVLQFTVFFGLLTFYLLMLPRLGRAFLFDEWWRPAVSLLNLTAIAMALATFTGRFVYPLLSLEGRRLWVLALAPWPRHRIVTAKLAFALVVGLPVSAGLVVLSGVMLALPPLVVAWQTVVMVCLALGLSAGALGLGARLADYAEDNPAKLVAGYGGTVNLLASLVFAAALIVGAALPMLGPGEAWRWVAALLWVGGVTALWTRLFLGMAWRWFDALGEVPAAAPPEGRATR